MRIRRNQEKRTELTSLSYRIKGLNVLITSSQYNNIHALTDAIFGSMQYIARGVIVDCDAIHKL